MPVEVSWLSPDHTLLVVLSNQVTLTDIPVSQIQEMLANASHEVTVLHDLSAMTAIHIDWTRLPAVVHSLRHPNIGCSYYIRKHSTRTLVAIMRLIAKLVRQRVYVFSTIEAAAHHLQKQQAAWG